MFFLESFGIEPVVLRLLDEKQANTLVSLFCCFDI